MTNFTQKRINRLKKVAASFKSISTICSTVYDVVYFMNGTRYSCQAEEFPHLIKSLPF